MPPLNKNKLTCKTKLGKKQIYRKNRLKIPGRFWKPKRRKIRQSPTSKMQKNVISENHVENEISKRVQKAANDYVFQNSGKHKWMKSAEVDWNWPQTELNQIVKSHPKGPKIKQIWECPKQVETERKPNCSNILGENEGKTQNVGKVRFTAYFRIFQKLKK